MVKLEDLTTEDLDSIVYEVCADLASNTNNEGKDAQIEFLKVIVGMTEAEILEAVEATR